MTKVAKGLICAAAAIPIVWLLAAAAPATRGWIDVSYADLVDRRRLTHSGESVGSILARGAVDDLSLSMLDPILEPYGLVLADALDTLDGAPARPFVEVGALWQPGERQPAWAELLRCRSILVESDGAGRVRAFVPAPASGASAASEAYDRAWGVLRLVFDSERRALARKAGDRPEDHPLDVEVHPFVHDRTKSVFRLGLDPHRVRVSETLPRGDRAPFDFDALASFLERAMLLEGGRIDEDGGLRILGSQSARKPEILGRAVALSDWAIAYRAVFHGGLAEPYMSLDRGNSPQTSIVNYGGRLRDTSIGLVSLLCDVRFKTFSQGIDVATDRDIRDEVRAKIPGFRTHLERFAADANTRGVTGQQTRLWFYPDDVDLTVSEQGDVLVLRRARLTASSERVSETDAPERPSDPPWTLDTVAAINRDYAKLGEFFPELHDLDQVARLLSWFAWLRQAHADGLAVPELDALLAVELPALSTPRRFPQLLAFNALPPAGAQGPADVISQTQVGAGLDRLESTLGVPVPAARRLERALRALDRKLPDHAKVAQEIEAIDRARLDATELDQLAYRAERLRMHQYVLSTLRHADREQLGRREPGLRVFSVGIGGLDLGMSKRVAIASQRSQQIAWGAAGSANAPAAPRAAASRNASEAKPTAEWKRDSSRLPKTEAPEAGGQDGAAARIESGSETWKDAKVSWTRTVYGANGPDPTSRRIVFDSERRVQWIERLEEGRLLRFRIEKDGAGLRARGTDAAVVPSSATKPPVPAAPPAGLAIVEMQGAQDAPAGSEGPTVSLRVRRKGSADASASVPRPILQRLVMGRDSDLTPGQSLSGWTPPAAILGEAGTLMVQASGDAWSAPPWEHAPLALPGEEDPIRLAAAAGAWWRAEPGPHAVVVGVDPAASPARWERAPKVSGPAVLLIPTDAFAEGAAPGRGTIASSWKGAAPVTELAGGASPAPVVLVSAEPPGVLADRLRRLAREPAMSGRLLAVVSLSGALRADLPSSLLAEGKLAGLGVAEAPTAGVVTALRALTRWSESIAATTSQGRRIEDLGAPFVWYF